MDRLFLTVLNMSLTGAFVIAVICLARLPLKKAPKIISHCLWAVAGFRLVFPFTLEGFFSLIPFGARPIPLDIAMQPAPHIGSIALPAAAPHASVNPLQVWTFVGTYVWLIVAAALLIYGIVSYLLLKHGMNRVSETPPPPQQVTGEPIGGTEDENGTLIEDDRAIRVMGRKAVHMLPGNYDAWVAAGENDAEVYDYAERVIYTPKGTDAQLYMTIDDYKAWAAAGENDAEVYDFAIPYDGR